MTKPATPDPQKEPRTAVPPLQRLAPWVDLFFKLSAGLAASIAVWRAFQ